MKKFLLLLIFSATSFFSGAQTNVYHPFPDSNATWNISGLVPWNCPFNVDYYETLSILISGDTAIGNYNYHKLNTPYIDRSCAQGGLHPQGYVGAFREDTSARKIFFVQPLDSSENLLYDFTMVVGDTVKGFLSSYWACLPYAQIVNSIDSTLVGGSYRKRWIIGTGWFKFIEGIGSTAGLLDHVCEIIDGPITSLLCFSQNGIVLYPSNAWMCNVITGIESVKGNAENQISISPNPFHSEAKLQNVNWGACRMKIYNTIGVLIREEKILNLTSYTLHRDGLNDGLYFYELRTSSAEMIATGKFIIE